MSEATAVQAQQTVDGTLGVWTRVLGHCAAWFVFTLPLTDTRIAVVAAMAGAVGVVAGRRVARTSLRAFTVPLASVLGMLLTTVAAAWLAESRGLADALGSTGLWLLVQSTTWLCVPLLASLCVSFLVHRRSAFAALEVLFVGFTAAEVVFEHRYGAIHRPFVIADPILQRGGDPSIAMFAIGGAAALVVVAVLLSPRNVFKGLVQLVVAALLILRVLTWIAIEGPPPPPPNQDPLGLRTQNEPKKDDNNDGKGSKPPPDKDLDFKDDNTPPPGRSPVALVLLRDDFSAPSQFYYFRQGAFSQYNGRRLVSSNVAGTDEDIPRSFSSAVPQNGAVSPFRRTVHTSVVLVAEHSRPFGLESPISYAPAPNPNPATFKRAYEVVSESLNASPIELLGANGGDSHWSPEVRAHYLAYPTTDARYGALAESITRELPANFNEDPVARAIAVVEYLNKEGTYSLRTRHSSASDPVASFLFGDKVGYCVHFAHAATYLLRAAGVPARVATGYMLAESGRAGGSSILIYSDNSHAWPEIYLDGVGWVIMDVSPEKALDSAPAPPDKDLQRLLGELARKETEADTEEAKTPMPSAKQLAQELLEKAEALLWALLWLLPVLALGVHVPRLFTEVAARIGSGALAGRCAHRAALMLLYDAGVRRQYGETLEALARRTAPTLPAFAAIAEDAMAERFGTQTANLARRRAALAELSRELAPLQSRWRLMWRRLSPLTWYLAR